MSEWEEMKKILMQNFTTKEIDEKAMSHLKNAFETTEEKWLKETRFVEVRRVIVGEAPLFKGESYIYNCETPNSSFLRPSDFPKSPRGNKSVLIDLMRKYGLVVVDSFPFAFNDGDTPAVTYSRRLKQKKYGNFLRESFSIYGARRIENILVNNPGTKVSFRYKRTDLLLGAKLDEIVRHNSEYEKRSDCLHGGISISRTKLHAFLE